MKDDTDTDTVGLDIARDWIGDVHGLQRRTRALRQGFWFPLILLGLVILASSPLYLRPEVASAGLPAATVLRARPAGTPLPAARPGQSSRRARTPFFPGGISTASPRAIAIYWLVTLPIAYLLIGWWYVLRARRRGVSTSPAAYVLVGIGLVALLVLTSNEVASVLHLPSWVAVFTIGDLKIRGLAALLTIGLGLFVLSYVERSRALAVFSAAFFGLALLVNLYDLQNMALRIGYRVGPELGVFVAGLFVLGGGVGFGLARRRSL